MSIFADRGKRTWVGAGEGQGRFAGGSCTGRGEIDIDIVNRLSGFPVVDEIWHEFCSCLLT